MEFRVPLEPIINRPCSLLRRKSYLRRKDKGKPAPIKDDLGSEKGKQEKISCERTHSVILSESATRQSHLSLLASGLAVTDICAATSGSCSKTNSAAHQVISSVALILSFHYWKFEDTWFFHQFRILSICPFFCALEEVPPSYSSVFTYLQTFTTPPEMCLEPFISASILNICTKGSTTITDIMVTIRLALPINTLIASI